MKKLITLTITGMILSLSSFAIDPIFGTPGACVGASQPLYDTSLGGVWSSSDISVATIGSSSGIAYGVSAGVATITYTVGAGYVTYGFTVTSTPPSPITGPASVCVGSSITLADPDPGGTWTTSTSAASIGSTTGVLTGLYADTVTVYYAIGAGCYRFTTVTVDATPALAPITGDSIVCVGSTVTYADAVSGGTWTSANPAIATVNSLTGVVTGVSTGATTISYSVTGVCGTGVTTRYTTVTNTTLTGTITSSYTHVDIGDYASMSDGVPGGTWSTSNPAIGTIDATGLFTGLSAGTVTISYTVTGCSGTASTTYTINVYSRIMGTVHFTGTPFYGSVKVWLITYNPSTFDLEAADSQVVISTGSSVQYYFDNPLYDSFRIKAAIDTFTTTGYVPTYHDSSFYWHDASVFYHTGAANDDYIDVTMMTGTYTSGPGFIAGDVTTGANKGTSGGGPAINIQMCVVNSTTHKVVQQARTNSSGHYSFSNLPVGQTYYVFPDTLNFMTTPYTAITLTTANPSFSAASFVQHTLSHTITPILVSVPKVNGNANTMSVFPNPASRNLSIQWNIPTTENGTIVINDMAGREVYRLPVVLQEGNWIRQIELPALSNGTYNLSVQSATVSFDTKIEIQR